MNDQQLLFSLPCPDVQRLRDTAPHSHRDDPETSREAGERLRASGKLTGQRKAVLEALRERNGSTHAELGAFMGTHWLTAARRLPELERAGLVRKGEPRICTIKGSRCTTWWVEPSHGRPRNTCEGHRVPPEAANGCERGAE